MTVSKMNILKGLEKAKLALDNAIVAGTAGAVGLGVVGINASAEAVSPKIDLTGVNFDGLVTAITEAVPQVLPVVVTVVGIRKAISFIIGTIRGC